MIRRWLVCICLSVLFSATVFAAPVEMAVQMPHSQTLSGFKYSPSGAYVVTTSHYDGEIKVWHLRSGRQLRTIRTADNLGNLNDFDFLPDETRVVAACEVGIEILNLETGGSEGVYRYSGGALRCLAVSPGGRYAVTGADNGKLTLWGIPGGNILGQVDGHEGAVNAVGITPDGKKAVSAGADGDVIVWRLDGSLPTRLHVLKGHEGAVNDLGIDPTGTLAASGGADRTLRIWDIGSGEPVRLIRGRETQDSTDHPAFRQVRFSPDGKRIATGDDSWGNSIQIWDSASGKELRVIYGHPKPCVDIRFSPDGTRLMEGSYYDDLRIWDVATGKQVRVLGEEMLRIIDIAFSPDGKYFITPEADKGVVNLRATATGRVERTFGSEQYDEYYYASFSRDGRKLLGKGGYGWRIWDVGTGRTLAASVGRGRQQIRSAVFSGDERFVITWPWGKSPLTLWDARTGKFLKTLTGDTHITENVVTDPAGEYLYTWNVTYPGRRAGIRKWSIETGAEITGFAKDYRSINFMTCLAWDYETNSLIVGTGMDRVEFLDPDTGKPRRICTTGERLPGRELHLNRSRTHAVTLTSYEGDIAVWELATGKVVGRFSGHEGVVEAADLSPDGRFLLSTAYDNTLRVWDMTTGKEMLLFLRPKGKENDFLVAAPDGHFDGTRAGIQSGVHFVQGMEVLPLESFYEALFTPNLWARLMAGERFTATVDFSRFVRLPPEIRIIEPDTRIDEVAFRSGREGVYVTNSPNLPVKVAVTDKGGGVNEVRLFLNGKLVEAVTKGLDTRNGDRRVIPATVELAEPVNFLKAVAFNADRTESLPHEIEIRYTRAASGKAVLYLMIVGIDTYKNRRYNLNYAVTDARAFESAVTAGAGEIFGGIRTERIENEQAVKERILDTVQDISRRAEPNDMFIFYYAGHGVMSEGGGGRQPEFYLAPHDVTRMYGAEDMLAAKGISASELMEMSKQIKARKQIVILDACQSSGALEVLAFRGAAEEKAIAQLARSTGTHYLTASGSQQFAVEFAELGHGAFTYAILEGLKGKADGGGRDRKITAKELASFVEEFVPELTEKTRGTAQYPAGYSYGQDFPIVVVK